jgi:cytochrome o ubiquinol oxidase subunit 1
MGAGPNVNAFFGIMTMIIAIPTGVKVFNWLFTMYRGRITFSTPMLWFMGFVLTFTIGGVTGVLMSVPAIDFQMHNSLFLVAHFHNMIIGGVVFGYIAGFVYWFPKVFGFKLHEGLGKIAFFNWVVGFVLAFIPLYILGMMGAARRMDSYDASLGWQGLFIVSGIGILFILAGIGFQVLQVAYSIWKRKEFRDTTGDPWDGRTLEWATPSPTPVYNFITIPHVTTRDAFWEMKQHKLKPQSTVYEDIHLPKNTPMGMYIALAAGICAFALIWHIWWLALLGFVGIIVAIIVRSLDEDTEYTIPAATVKKMAEGAKS